MGRLTGLEPATTRTTTESSTTELQPPQNKEINAVFWTMRQAFSFNRECFFDLFLEFIRI